MASVALGVGLGCSQVFPGDGDRRVLGDITTKGFRSCLTSSWMLGQLSLWVINSFIHLLID